jgi:selenide,water dikinase
MDIDLLNLVDQGGCSAKLPALELEEALRDLPSVSNSNVLVDIDTHDDAGVYKLRDDYALVQTTDFFPPVCSDPYDFGQVAAANALSDIYAMGAEVISVLNLVLFPADIHLSVLSEILRGGQDKVLEAGGVVLGGHTIADAIPKYGLAVTGWVHPDQIITNSSAKVGQSIILTKAIGTGVIISAKKNDLVDEAVYRNAVESMKQLNNHASEIMKKYKIQCATDITGFGLLGHALKMAKASGVSIKINAKKVPVMDQLMELIELGCIPGAGFRNVEFAEEVCSFHPELEYNQRMMLADAQTSGGLLIAVDSTQADSMIQELKEFYPFTSAIGEVLPESEKTLYLE